MMNANREKIYNYSHLFAVTLVFSALATEIFLLYLLLRESFWIPFEPIIVAIMLCTLFSALGQRLSRVNEIERWIFFVSAFSSVLYYIIFLYPIRGVVSITLIITYGLLIFIWGWFALWEFLNYGWIYLSQRKIAKKPVVVIFGIGILGILAFFFASVYSTAIISFLDSHPWAMTLVGVLITLFGGIFVGRRTKKS